LTDVDDDRHPIAVWDRRLRRLLPHRLGGEIDQGGGSQGRDRLTGDAGIAVVGGSQRSVDARAQCRSDQVGVVGGEVAVEP
jgi:hypothetical protein